MQGHSIVLYGWSLNGKGGVTSRLCHHSEAGREFAVTLWSFAACVCRASAVALILTEGRAGGDVSPADRRSHDGHDNDHAGGAAGKP